MDISIIIPCYNHGLYLRDAIESVSSLQGIHFEIIIVNDGSTDAFTIQILSQLENEGYRVIHQPNLGLGAARNTGIGFSKGKYILPLDSDNKIKHEYVVESLKYLETDIADIVYSNPEFFGELEPYRLFKPDKFDIVTIFKDNYIDACAVYRKTVWEKNKGYETNMPFQGHEDWEFWINAYSNGFRFKYLDRSLYYYRMCSNSMIVHTRKENRKTENHKFIIRKHLELFMVQYDHLYHFRKITQLEKSKPLRASLRYFLIWLGLKK